MTLLTGLLSVLLTILGEPLQLLPKLFGLPAKLLFFPALLHGLLRHLLLRQFLLTLCELLQLLERLVDLFLLIVFGVGARLPAFVLVLLRIKLEVKQTREVATGARRSVAAALLLSERDFDVAEDGFGAQ